MKTKYIMIDGPEGTKPLSGEIASVTGHINANTVGMLVIMAHDIPFSHSRDHDDLFGWMRGLLAEHGYTSLMFDFQSCGDSKGRKESLSLEVARENLMRVIAWAKTAGYERFVFVGCGTTAALMLELTDENTKMVILFWPAVDLACHAQKIFYRDGEISASKDRKIASDLVTQMETYDPMPLMKNLKVPISIHYGDTDEVTSPEQIEFIKRNLNALRIDITSYLDGVAGLTDPRHRKAMAHHIGTYLQKYA